MAMENLQEGLYGASVPTEEAIPVPVYDENFAHAINTLEKWGNAEFSNLLKELTGEQREMLYMDLGGEWQDIVERGTNIEAAQTALTEYIENIPTDFERYEVTGKIAKQKEINRREAVKRLKASMIV